MSCSLAIIIVSYNTRTELEHCLATIAEHPPSVPYEIVVVDNASSDGSVAAIRARWPSLQVVEAGDNLGFARATNLGIRSTSSDWILLLNSDTEVPEGAVDGLLTCLQARPGAAAVGPRLVDHQGRLEISFGAMLSPWAELIQKCLVLGHRVGLPILSALAERRARHERTVDWVSGACLLVRRRAAEAVGLLDERFFLYTEDVDFCAALRELGQGVLFTPAVEVVHARGRSRRHAPERAQAAYRRSHLAFYAKHHPSWYPLLRGYLWLRGQLPFPESPEVAEPGGGGER